LHIAIEAGDDDAAREALAAAIDFIDGAADVGNARLTTALAVGLGLTALLAVAGTFWRRTRRRRSGRGDVFAVDQLGDRHVDLDEDALAGARLGSVHDVSDVTGPNPRKAAGTTGVIEGGTVLSDIGNAVLELDEDVRTVVDADPVTGAEVLVDPDAHDGDEPYR
jgi:hypothetical protein